MAYVKGKNPFGETLDYNDGVTDGADTIIGLGGNDIIHAGGGNDTIKGGGGADHIDGGAGRDMVSYEDSTVGVEVSLASGKGKFGSAEGDTLVSVEDLTGSAHDDKLAGNSQDNKLAGGAGNDTLKGGGGSDTLIGGSGNDTLEIDGIGDLADGGDGIDTVVLTGSQGKVINLLWGFVDANLDGPGYFGLGWDGNHPAPMPLQPQGTSKELVSIENAVGTAYHDDIYGTDGANVLSGGNGNDMLVGFAGNDTLAGGNGNDFLIGGLGADTMTGGAGADRFVFHDFAESLMAGGKPQDTVTDFQQGTDKLDFSALDFALADLLVLDGQTLDGANHSLVGVDANHNGAFDAGEFAVAVQLAGVFNAGDLIL